MIDWRIYYADATTYSSDDGTWMDATLDRVICVVVRDPTEVWGCFVNSGFAPKKVSKVPYFNNYYVCLPKSKEPRATFELKSFHIQAMAAGLTEKEYERCIKNGEQAEQQVWNDIMLLAGKDPDFPKGTPRRRYTDGG